MRRHRGVCLHLREIAGCGDGDRLDDRPGEAAGDIGRARRRLMAVELEAVEEGSRAREQGVIGIDEDADRLEPQPARLFGERGRLVRFERARARREEDEADPVRPAGGRGGERLGGPDAADLDRAGRAGGSSRSLLPAGHRRHPGSRPQAGSAAFSRGRMPIMRP
ncbi:MAG: hypothetical protein KatS3mg119_0407 [Rhodothalassiaceae bacterium]|nr:MAG: hypothetical protein KatS3mg119_0407 [Rhodothalassiaceae bacterium]